MSNIEAVAQHPYKPYEISEITFSPLFYRNWQNYVVTLETRIVVEANYQVAPLESKFDCQLSAKLHLVGFCILC